MRHTSKLAILLVSLVICSLLPADSHTASRATPPVLDAAESDNPVQRARMYMAAELDEPADAEEAVASTTRAVRRERATRTVRPQPTITTVRNDEARSELRIFIEAFVDGRELTVAVLGGEALPVVEIVPAGGFYDYEHKYTSGKSEYIVPAEVSEEIADAARTHALAAFSTLGCRGVARVDFRLSPDNELFCLEVNTVPGMTELSLVPMAARKVGLDFPALTEKLCQLAIGV